MLFDVSGFDSGSELMLVLVMGMMVYFIICWCKYKVVMFESYGYSLWSFVENVWMEWESYVGLFLYVVLMWVSEEMLLWLRLFGFFCFEKNEYFLKVMVFVLVVSLFFYLFLYFNVILF